MKKLVLGLMATVMFVCLGNAQTKNDGPINGGQGKFYIYWATWDDWGHGPDCRGWGLCNYTDCWFCGGDNKHRGEVKFDKETKEGYLYVVLDPSFPLEKEAIDKKSVFLVDTNIDNKNSVLHAGKYEFDAEVGKYGGYKVAITIKQ